MASAGWVYQRRENSRKFSLSSGGNVAEKTVEVKAGKFWWLRGADCGVQVAGPLLREPITTGNPQPTSHDPERALYKSARFPDCSSRPDFDSLPQKIKHASDL